MDKILLLDTSVGSLNKGDDIIMNSVKSQLSDITKDAYVLTLPTHISPFHWYQVARGSNRVKLYSDAKYKFVGGTNLLTMDMLTHFPQWNINLFNYKPLKGSILVGVGAGKGNKINTYTKVLYKKVLSHEYIHSVRDERTKHFLEEMGFKALNTGCATLWSLTTEFCEGIPAQKADSVIFTLTHHDKDYANDQYLIDILNKNYKDVYFWIQDADDLLYFSSLKRTKKIKVVSPTIEAYQQLLELDIDYIGTRLHGGIFAMLYKKRSIIIAIDERAQGMGETYNLNLIHRSNFDELEKMIHSSFKTDVKVNFEVVNKWLGQFKK
ncbi:polysaccharide pyruvyl transferase family protein [Bacillus pacificus]|uniref:polysaccharide pyruvyl transferase family protein n=1 Tax=Bacillus pacificus TaxID=2026187 RepID=UPI003D1B7DB5